jgi:uroporphyrinogen III methyltransferase/synthase
MTEQSPARVGTVYLVGAGPGDPGLLTVRGRQLLDACDAIVHDALVHPSLLERPEATGSAPPEVHFVGKRGGDERSARQEDINALLVALAREGKDVVRLKGGDPFVFGRGSEEAQALAEAQVPFEIVPGVTSGIAAPAYAGIPVTHRGMATSVTLVTGHEDPEKGETQTDWRALAKVATAGGTLVLYMGVKRLAEIARTLVTGGAPGEMPAAAVQWGTMPRQRVVTGTLDTIAADIARAGLAAPVITTIGWTALLRDEIAWFDRRPLFGRTIAVTRAAQQASALADRLRALGADVLEMPATRIERLDAQPAQDAIARLKDYRLLVFTSQNAVSIFWEQLLVSGRDARALAGSAVCAVGPATAAALLDHGIAVDFVPERFVAEGILEALKGRDLKGTRVLYASAEGSREVLPDGLRAMGATVDVVPLYRSTRDGANAGALRKALEKGKVDLVTFTSGSAVQGFVDAVGPELARGARGASIGPVTSEAMRAAGIDVRVEAGESTIPALADAVAALLGGAGRADEWTAEGVRRSAGTATGEE